MKRVVKKGNKKKKNIRIQFCFIMLIMVYLGSAIFLRNHNASLEQNLNRLTSQNNEISSENLVLRLRIDELSSFERMASIAAQNGLTNREGTIRNVG